MRAMAGLYEGLFVRGGLYEGFVRAVLYEVFVRGGLYEGFVRGGSYQGLWRVCTRGYGGFVQGALAGLYEGLFVREVARFPASASNRPTNVRANTQQLTHPGDNTGADR